MRQRPIACLALLVFLILSLLPAGFFYEPLEVTGKCEAQVIGRVSRLGAKNDKTQIYLTDCYVEGGSFRFETGQILVYLTETAEYPVGTDLSLSGTIYPIEEPTNPGQFNSRLYYQGKGISYTFYAKNAEILNLHSSPVRQKLLTLRKRLQEVYEQILDEKDSGLMQAMVLGRKEELDNEIKELYQKNGISHLLAISGLHVSLAGMGLYRLLRRSTGSYVLSGVPAILFLLAYGWMTGASISTVRAVLMCSMAILADLIGRTYDMLTGIGASALCLMLTSPVCVKQSAFLLSYGAVSAIALLPPIWKLYREKSGRTMQALSVSLSVLMVTFPLLLCFFYEYPLYSTLLNLLVIPLMSVLMVFGFMSGVTGLFCLPAAGVLVIPCHLILKLYAWTGQHCLSLPGSVLTTGCPEKWKVLLYYGFLSTGLFLLYREKRRKKYWRKKEPFCPGKRVLAAGLGPILLCACLLCLRISSGLEICMLDVGQGDSVFFKTPGGTTCLYDGGSSNVKGAGIYRILPFLKWSGVRTLDYVFISHMDQDHISGLRELAEECRGGGGFRIGHAVLPKLSVRDEACEEMEAVFREAGIPILYMGVGDRLEEKEFSLSCLWPAENAVSEDRNDLSLVLMAEYGEFQMLLTGDIGAKTEEILLSSDLLKEVEILKTAHHGSRYSSTASFLDRVHPAVSLISCSAANRYGHPGKETLERLKAAGSRVCATKDCGAIRIWTDGEQVRIKSVNKLTFLEESL
ncbi:MAG: DNA internalization-related competence protein ComEC/Rec2 [Lachnospiraceae bacterium]|nr:DNA internalization-related competence protein ComEC/Rec2 [Lachnospiraceae bacterium]